MMQVIKRDGSKEEVRFDKITNRIKKQCWGLDPKFVDYNAVALTVFAGLFDGVTSTELDNLAAESAASLTSVHPDYAILASRIAVSSLHKETDKSFVKTIKTLYEYVDEKTGKSASLIADDVYEFIIKNKAAIESAIIHDRDFGFEYFGYKTLEKSYLLKVNGKTVERPQHLWMRVACGIWSNNLEQALKTYELLSEGFFTHATPTLFNAGTRKPQLSSCFLLTVSEDSLENIYKVLTDTAMISKHAGGIGISISKVRATGAYVKGTNGISNGIVPMLKVFNETARYVDQGGGKRKGSFAIYLEPWHADVLEFLELRKPQGKEERRARDLFTALWTPDLFLERVEQDADWTLFSPDEAPGLDEVYGDEFKALYERYEAEGRGRETIKARELASKIQDAQMETGTPYMAYKDEINRKSNQKNLGTIKSSNLCIEIVEFTSADEEAVCNLASIALPKYIVDGVFNHKKLYDVTYQAAINLDRVIDINYYPTIETQNSNFRHRPIAIGSQGLADTFALLKMPFESAEAKVLSREIAETMYFAAISASADLAERDGVYSSFEGSPASKGLLQYDMWQDREVGTKDGTLQILSSKPVELSGRWDFQKLKAQIKRTGLKNSMSIGYMPTASTGQILGNNETNEPFTANIYKRRVLSGEFVMVNKHLVKELIELNLWSKELKNTIVFHDGSVQNISELPQWIKEVYKTVWEIKQRSIIDLAADRGAFTCQTQSMNLFFSGVNKAKLTSAMMYGWKKGLKTGIYYTRTKSVAEAQKGLGMDVSKMTKIPEDSAEGISCSIDNPEGCDMCGS
jgi:ribonucleoside-diphosphate reductase alpha chain